MCQGEDQHLEGQDSKFSAISWEILKRNLRLEPPYTGVPRPSGPDIPKKSQKDLPGPPGPECQKKSQSTQKRVKKVAVFGDFVDTFDTPGREAREGPFLDFFGGIAGLRGVETCAWGLQSSRAECLRPPHSGCFGFARRLWGLGGGCKPTMRPTYQAWLAGGGL